MTAQLGASDLELFQDPQPEMLQAVSGIQPEPTGIHVLIEDIGVRSTQRLALSRTGNGFVAALWPAELKTQSTYLYGKRLATPMIARARERGWSVESSPHLAFRNSAPAQRLYMCPTLDALEYARRWESGDLEHVGQYMRDAVTRTLWPWLKARGYADDNDDPVLNLFLISQLGNRPAFLRPGLRFKRRWTVDHPVATDERGRIAAEIRSDVNAILGAAKEPPLPRREH